MRRIGITGPRFMIPQRTLSEAGETMTTLLLLVASIAAPPQSLPCPPPLAKAHARCESVTVAEDPATPGGRTIALNVVVVPAIRKKAGEPPMFHFEGGP